MKPIVFVPERIAVGGMDLLRAECDCLAPWLDDGSAAVAKPQVFPAAVDAVLVRLFPVRSGDMPANGRLKVIAKHGVGVDNIDVAAATARRIPVVFTPTANTNAVVEHTLALMLALARNLHVAANSMLAGGFTDRAGLEGVELAGKTLGVLGLGRVGARVAEAARWGCNMDVRGYDPFISQATYGGTARLESSLEDLLAAADFLTLHMPLTPATSHLLDADRLQRLRPTCRLINTSRGGIVDEAALAQARRDGRIAGAALDVFEQEPLPADHPFFQTPNMLLTPHIASSTKESLDRMACDAAQGVLDVLRGKRAAHVVNPEVWK